MKKSPLGLVAIIVAASFSTIADAEDHALVMPSELVDYARSQGCVPITNFYERPGMLNPPYVYGFAGGEAEESAAVWCQSNEKSDKPYRLLLKVSDPSVLKGCADRIDWWNYPKGLSVETRAALSLSQFHFVTDPKRRGPTITLSRTKVIVSEYDGVEEVFICHRGQWLFLTLD